MPAVHLRHLRHHPRIALALKAGLATTLAWALVQSLGGVADRYPYYAPLGAIIATGTTVTASVRDTLEGVLSIMLGASLAILMGYLGVSGLVAVGVVVAGGTLLAGWNRLGGKATWVPFTALFVLIIGGDHELTYAFGYLALVTVGATVGIAVNLAFPPLPLTATWTSVTNLRNRLAEQLDDLAEGLLQETPPDEAGWRERRRAVRPLAREMHDMVAQATEARRGNWRIRRWQHEADGQYEQARALELLAFLVEEMTTFVTSQESSDRDEVPLGPTLRPYAAHAFQETAEALRSVQRGRADADCLEQADAALTRLVEEVRTVREESSGDLFGAGALVMTLRRTVTSLRREPAR